MVAVEREASHTNLEIRPSWNASRIEIVSKSEFELDVRFFNAASRWNQPFVARWGDRQPATFVGQ